MEQRVNRLYSSLFTSNHRYYIFLGGRGAGRSFVASQYALANLVSPDYFRCAIMRFILGDIRNSIYQEIVDRAEEQETKDNLDIKEHNLSITYGQNKINGIGFRKSSSEQKGKLKSLASYNAVIIEEADEVAEDDFMQLDDSLRTLKSDIKIVLLLNPPDKNHWIVRRWCNLEPSGIEGFYVPELKSTFTDTKFIHTTYLDNIVNLNQSTVRNFERYKETRPDYYYNMIKGLVSEGARGRIFKNWKTITDKEFDELPYPSIFGLDYGFSNDPAALIETKEHNDRVYLKEWVYQTGLINKLLSDEMSRLGVPQNAIIYADSAEPKSIAEMQTYGWSVLPAEKGADSVKAGLDYLLGKEVFYTESSTNLAREIQEYKWALDKNKEPTNDPIDDFNHLLDASRYAIFRKKSFVGFA